MSEPEQKPAEEKKPTEKLTHPIPGKRVDYNSKEPLKNINRQIALVGNIGKEITGEDMRKAGYSASYSEMPGRLKTRKSFTQLLHDILPDDETLYKHHELLNSRRLDHMTFPLKIDDQEIAELLASVNCVLRKVVHGEQAKHAYFWSMDNKARKDALDMIYKLKGQYAPDKIEDVSRYRNLSTEELMKRKKAALDFFKKRPTNQPPAS